MKRFPFKHLSLAEVNQRESLILMLRADRLQWNSPGYHRLSKLIARTSSACANYPRQRVPEPEIAA